MLDQPSLRHAPSAGSTRGHHFGSSRRAFRPKFTAWDHCFWGGGGFVIIAIAVVLGVLVSEEWFLLLLLLLPWFGYYYVLKNKVERMELFANAMSPDKNNEQQDRVHQQGLRTEEEPNTQEVNNESKSEP